VVMVVVCVVMVVVGLLGLGSSPCSSYFVLFFGLVPGVGPGGRGRGGGEVGRGTCSVRATRGRPSHAGLLKPCMYIVFINFVSSFCEF